MNENEDENDAFSPNFDDEQQTLVVASRWQRLWASLIDTMVILAIVIPIMFLTGGFEMIASDQQPTLIYSIGMSVISILVFVAFNGKHLVNNGQTIGKKTLGIKIVTLEGNLPSVKEHLLKRYGVYFLLDQIPFIGGILSLINVLLIFGNERRCGHDLVAETMVVQCEK